MEYLDSLEIPHFVDSLKQPNKVAFYFTFHEVYAILNLLNY